MPPETSTGTRPAIFLIAAAACSGVKLSSRIICAPAASASSICSGRSTSISTWRSPAAATARRVASPTDPAIRTWLSLTRIAESRPERWGVPPPTDTARFSSRRRSGVVLRVSRIFAFVPATASTNPRVMVAMPDMRCRKFRATRSPVRMPRADPVTDAIALPASKRSPSRARVSQSIFGSTTRNTSRATSRPATTKDCLATKTPVACASASTVASVVASRVPTSSSMAWRTMRRTRSGSMSRMAQGSTRLLI